LEISAQLESLHTKESELMAREALIEAREQEVRVKERWLAMNIASAPNRQIAAGVPAHVVCTRVQTRSLINEKSRHKLSYSIIYWQGLSERAPGQYMPAT
jgi:hypothetical protein